MDFKQGEYVFEDASASSSLSAKSFLMQLPIKGFCQKGRPRIGF
jgi:hypothetical protein